MVANLLHTKSSYQSCLEHELTQSISEKSFLSLPPPVTMWPPPTTPPPCQWGGAVGGGHMVTGARAVWNKCVFWAAIAAEL